MSTILKNLIQLIKNETLPSANTANRVGTTLEYIDTEKADRENTYTKSEVMDLVNEIKLLASSDAKFIGSISPTTPINPDGNIWAFAEAGTYPNSGGLVVNPDTLTILSRAGGVWSKIEVELPSNAAENVFNPLDDVKPSTMKAASERWDNTIFVLEDFVNPPDVIEWVEIVMPYSGEVDAKVYLPNFSMENYGSDKACGGIPLTEFVGYEFLKITGDFQDGHHGVMWLGGLNESTNIYARIVTGNPVFPNDTYITNVNNAYQFYIYSRDKVKHKFFKGKTVSNLPQMNSVKEYIDDEIANINIQGELNFKDFGAKCDRVTNDTQAFKDAINYLINNGGGKIRLSGVMLIDQTAIPYTNNTKMCTIEIVGDYTPTGIYGSVGSMPVSWTNSTILCTSTQYDANKGVIYTNKGAGLYDYNCITFVLKNVVVRTTDGAPINALNFTNFQQAIVKDVNIDTGIYAGQTSEPLERTYGLIMPKRDNGALSIVDNVYTSGYWVAQKLQEHTVGNNLQINCCKVGLELSGAGHPILVGRVLMQKCKKLIEVTDDGTNAAVVFDVQQLAVEKASISTITPGHEWQLPDTFDVYDTASLSRGFITYNATIGGVSLNVNISKTGGAGIKIRKIGGDWS